MRPADSISSEEVGVILAGALAGDRRAEHALTERVLLPILDAAVSRRLIGSRGTRFEKTDVIQEVFHHLYQDGWRRLRAFDAGKGSLASYVWGVVSGWLRDHGRRLPPPEPTDELEIERSPESGPEAKAQLGELIARLKQALSDEDLALFQWAYLEGAPHEALAARLGVSLEATYKRVQRMEAKIRVVVSGEAVIEPRRGGEP